MNELPEMSEDVKNLNRDILSNLNSSPSTSTLGRAKVSKYGNIRTGHYASRKEARYAAELELRQKAGDISFWLEQVPFRLPGGVIHRVDFEVIKIPDDKNGVCFVYWVEVKGKDLAMGKLKRKQVEDIYKIHIEVV